MKYEELVKFLKDNNNDIKNFELSLSGKEINSLIKLVVFGGEAAKFFAEQEHIKGTPGAESEFLTYEDYSNYFMKLLASTMKSYMSQKSDPEERH